jgi:hypothetical protein
MNRLRLLPILAALAVLAPAGAASAADPDPTLPKPSDPAFAVPQGKVEHSITTVKVTGTKAVPRHERVEQWLSRTHGRTIITDLSTGRIDREIAYKPGEYRVYDRKNKTVRVMIDPRRPATPPWNSMAFEAAVQKAYVEQGYVKVTGETTVRGRRALITENTPPKWRSDNPNSKTIAVVDAETFHLYERTTFDGELFRQHATYDAHEILDQDAGVLARMAMTKRKHVKVTRKVKR